MQTRNRVNQLQLQLQARKSRHETKITKRQRSPPSEIEGTLKRKALVDTVIPEQANSKTVFLVCNFHGQLKYQYAVFILHIGTTTTSRRALEPVIRMDKHYPAGMAFALSPDNKLFMFGGFYQNKGGEKREWESRAFMYDELPKKSGGQSKTHNLEMKLLHELPKMKPRKISPAAVLVKNQICVFSTVLYRVDEHEEESSGNFELIDPETCLWTVLREPMDYSQFSKTIKVEAHCVTNSSLIISTNHGIYIMDFNQSIKAWCRVEISLGSSSKYPTLNRLPFLGASIMIENICLTPSHAFKCQETRDPKNETIKYSICASSSSPNYSQVGNVSDGIEYVNGPDDTPVPAFGDMALTHLGSNNFCRIKVGFKDTESKSKANPFLIGEAFEMDEAALENNPNHKLSPGPELLHEYAHIPALDLGKPCGMVSIKGLFPMDPTRWEHLAS